MRPANPTPDFTVNVIDQSTIKLRPQPITVTSPLPSSHTPARFSASTAPSVDWGVAPAATSAPHHHHAASDPMSLHPPTHHQSESALTPKQIMALKKQQQADARAAELAGATRETLLHKNEVHERAQKQQQHHTGVVVGAAKTTQFVPTAAAGGTSTIHQKLFPHASSMII